jgi:hypothetical protein
LGDGIEIIGDESGTHPHSSGGEGGFDPGVSCSDD